MLKDAQSQAIKGSARVTATSRTVSKEASMEESVVIKEKCAITSAQDWQSMVKSASKIQTTGEAQQEAKVTVKVNRNTLSRVCICHRA